MAETPSGGPVNVFRRILEWLLSILQEPAVARGAAEQRAADATEDLAAVHAAVVAGNVAAAADPVPDPAGRVSDGANVIAYPSDGWRRD